MRALAARAVRGGREERASQAIGGLVPGDYDERDAAEDTPPPSLAKGERAVGGRAPGKIPQ